MTRAGRSREKEVSVFSFQCGNYCLVVLSGKSEFYLKLPNRPPVRTVSMLVGSNERHAFWLAKPLGASHIRNSIHSPLYCMFRSSGVHHGQNSFKYLQNISPIIPWLSFVISIILEGHFVFWVMHFICSYLRLVTCLATPAQKGEHLWRSQTGVSRNLLN